MKTIRQIFRPAALGLAAALSFTACEVDTTTVMFEEDHTLTHPGDTVFSVLGIMAKVQAVAGRTVLLGELRGDLVTPNPSAVPSSFNEAWFDLANFEHLEDSTFNRYRDFYAIVNNCNFFLSRVDASAGHGAGSIFRKEYAAVSAYRAWAYLQLALNYGEVPFYTEPLLSYSDIERVMDDASNRRGLEDICTYFINELEPFTGTEPPAYGGFLGARSWFLPVYLLRGDLYLWRASKTGSAADYAMAAQQYANYLWLEEAFIEPDRDAVYLSDAFGEDYDLTGWNGGLYMDELSCIPMGTEATEDGVVNTLPGKFAGFLGSASMQAQADTVYYCFVANTEEDDPGTGDGTGSSGNLSRFEGLVDISAYYPLSDGSPNYVPYIGVTGTPQYVTGDLRFQDARETEASYGGWRIGKYGSMASDIVTYRSGVVYLRLAESINRAGYPNTAFAVLKYGLGRGNLVRYDANGELYRMMRSGYDFFDLGGSALNIGIHARGCGNAEMDELHYSIPAFTSHTDSVEWVEEMICNEMALETAYEGHRFYDLMRISFSRRDPAFLAGRVARRDSPGQPDARLLQKLSDERNWYLPMVEN